MFESTTNITTSRKITYVVAHISSSVKTVLESTKSQLLACCKKGIKSYQSNQEHPTKPTRREVLQALGKEFQSSILRYSEQSMGVCKGINVRPEVQSAPGSYLLGKHKVHPDRWCFVQNLLFNLSCLCVQAASLGGRD